ncbi:MAG: hypothetical protein ACE5IR_12765 [bacterium]
MNTIAKTSDLPQLVSSICNGTYKEIELIEFVNLIQKISLSYLKYQEVIGKHIRWERGKNISELEDLALDCVAGLFMRDEKNEFVQFNRYFCQHSTSIEDLDEVEIMVLLRRLVIKKTKQELSRIFKERDPEGAKIVRNIKVAIKSSSDFESFREMGREYIYLRNGNGRLSLQNYSPNNGKHSNNGRSNGVSHNGHHSPRNKNGNTNGNGYGKANGKTNGNGNGNLNYAYLRKTQPTIPEKTLRGEYLNLYHPKDPVSLGIRKMLMAIKSEEKYQNFLPLDMVARIMRTTNLEVARDRLVSEVNDVSPLDDLKIKEIEKRKYAVLKKIKKKIQSQYVNTSKISETKGAVYYQALADILDDISQGKKYDSYFKHLRRYMPELTQKAYRTEERTIFEYLGKLIKKWFRESLIELL